MIGVDLGDGWTITHEIAQSAAATGGNFSLGYLARHTTGREGFVKVINYHAILFSADPTGMMQIITEAYNFERDIVEKCSQKRLTRVVSAYRHDSLAPAGAPYPLSFIIFERAKNDVRAVLDSTDNIDLAVKLRMVHNAAAGISQLHAIGVAHQDVKPSNLLIFDTRRGSLDTAKIGDLGRATDAAKAARHDVLTIAGDPRYAPPEQQFGEIQASFGARRLACDIYQLGNLLSFVLAGVTMNSLIDMYLDPTFSPRNWRGTYADVFPYVQAAHAAALSTMKNTIDEPLRDELIGLIAATTDPDVTRRGHLASRRAGQPYSMNRIVTELDLLSRKAETFRSTSDAA
ncbi:protein kinase domain-containing protein [Arthrobacter sp. MDT1-48-3]